MTNMRPFCRCIGLGIVMPVVMLTCGGCEVGPCCVPIYMMPVVLVASTASLIEDHCASKSEADFLLAGRLVDDRGRPLDGVDAEVTEWTISRPTSGAVCTWEKRIEHRTLGSHFRLAVDDAHAIDIVMRRPGYADQRVIATCGPALPGVLEFARLDPSEGPRRDFTILPSGELLAHGYYLPVKRTNVRIILHPREHPANEDPGTDSVRR